MLAVNLQRKYLSHRAQSRFEDIEKRLVPDSLDADFR
jgi:hypothetical protein